MFYSFDENGLCVFSSPNNITGDMIESDINEDIMDIIYKDGNIRKMTEEEKEKFYSSTEPEETMETTVANALTKMIKSKVESETTIDPSNVTLFSLISDENKGSGDNPIELTDDMNILYDGYLYEYGKIYLYKGIKYKCTRAGESDGTFIKLYYYPDALIGHYFALV